jgi:hypothetical protein
MPDTPTPTPSRTVTALVLCRGCDAEAERTDPPGWQVDDPPAGRRTLFRLGTCPDCLERYDRQGGVAP